MRCSSKGRPYYTSIILLDMTIRHIKIIVTKGKHYKPSKLGNYRDQNDRWIPAFAGMTIERVAMIKRRGLNYVRK
jgi:hypothetical protein